MLTLSQEWIMPNSTLEYLDTKPKFERMESLSGSLKGDTRYLSINEFGSPKHNETQVDCILTMHCYTFSETLWYAEQEYIWYVGVKYWICLSLTGNYRHASTAIIHDLSSGLHHFASTVSPRESNIFDIWPHHVIYILNQHHLESLKSYYMVWSKPKLVGVSLSYFSIYCNCSCLDPTFNLSEIIKI